MRIHFDPRHEISRPVRAGYVHMAIQGELGTSYGSALKVVS
jgi:hypothetical protein